jgi:hypothetical protein
MTPQIIREKTNLEKTKDFVKVAVDTSRGILSMGCELHVDCYEQLIEDGSKPEDVWGANVYPADKDIEYTSMVNIRPPKNTTIEIHDEEIRNKVKEVIHKLLF